MAITKTYCDSDYVFVKNATPYDYSKENILRLKYRKTENSRRESKKRMHIVRMNRWINDPIFNGRCKSCGKPLVCDPTQPIKDKPEFHHTIPVNKTDSLNHMVNNYVSENKIYDEIKKGGVILLCHECHADTDNFGVNKRFL